MSAIAFWGDLHVGRLTKIVGEDGLRLHRKLLHQLTKETRQVGARYVAVLGDIFPDPFPSQEQMMVVLEAFSNARDLKFVCYLGNHDIYTAQINSLRLLSRLPEAGALTNVQFVIKPAMIDFARRNVLVLPYGAPLGAVPNNTDLILFHNNVIGAKRDNNSPVTGGFHPNKFEKVLAVGGHLHTPQRVGSRIYFPGTQGQLTFGEGSAKKFMWLDDRMYSRPFQPPWELQTVTWSNDNPPECNNPDTYYRLLFTHERPGPRWLANHPQVVSHKGGSKSIQSAAKQKVVSLIQRTNEQESDTQLLNRWLIQYTSLDKLARRRALKIDEQLAEEE